MFSWKRYEQHINSNLTVFSRGDRSVPPTRWWNHWYLLLTKAWKRAIVIEVEPNHGNPHAIFAIGYDPVKGAAMCRPLNRMTTKVAFRVGFEPCCFFALDSEGKQIPLRVVAELTPVVMLDEDVALV